MTKLRKIIYPVSMFVCGVIVALGLLNLYHLASKNLVLENWLLEQEIRDYITAKREAIND